MTPKVHAETQRRCHRLLFHSGTGVVMGTAFGGGALEELHGDAYLIALFNDADAPTKYGVIDRYFYPVHGRKPETVVLPLLPQLQAASDAVVAEELTHGGRLLAHGQCDRCDQLRQELVDARDMAVMHKLPKPVPRLGEV